MANGKVIVLIEHHVQPPFETPAETYKSVMEFDPNTPVREVFEACWDSGDVLSVSFPRQE